MPTMSIPLRFGLPALLLSMLLVACGGGGGGNEPAADATAGAGSTDATATSLALTGASRTVRPVTNPTAPTLTVRAGGSLAGNVGPIMEVRVNGSVIGRAEVRSTEPADYSFTAPGLQAGAAVDVIFINDALVDGQDRNLFVAYLTDASVFVTPTQPGVTLDPGSGIEATDGKGVVAGTEAIYFNAALRMTWPSAAAFAVTAREADSSRFLQQASFGPTRSEIARLNTLSQAQWLDEQLAMPAQPEYLTYIQGKYDLGNAYLPLSHALYTPDWIGQKFWALAATSPAQLRQRVAWALHNIFVVSQVDSNLFHHARAYAAYLDHLNRLAFGNYRQILEEVALSPAMGIYLSHMRNQKEDPATFRLPDENFARELMQLFSIGLYELNVDGSLKRNAQGQPVETYSNDDVMAMAKVFTGWSWGYDDNQLTEHNFRWGTPDAATRGNARVDIRRMKPYPGQWSTAEKRLFTGKPQAAVIPASTAPAESVRIALDTLFNHPNVGPFIGRQLIQRLVTGNPSADYVRRVALAFNDNGQGVRGDMAAVIRAVLLDPEARAGSTPGFGKVREPVMRLTHWMRSFGARSSSGEYLISTELANLNQRANYMPSVFGYFRPGYVPPASSQIGEGVTAPEMQIVDESTTANWVNTLELMLREGLGWHGTNRDLTLLPSTEAALIAQAPGALLQHLDMLLFAGRMSPALRKDIMDAIQGVPETVAGRDLMRARVAIFIAMASPEYLVQR